MIKKFGRAFLTTAILATSALSGALLLPSNAEAQTRIIAAVNNGVVTSNQLTQRMRFLRISGFKGDRRKEAQKQLIDEELQFQEAKRIGFSIPDSAVNEAFGRIASSNRLSASQFRQVLRQSGVNPATFMRLIKARILWQQIVVARARQQGTRSGSDQDVTSILFNRSKDGKNTKVKEYTLTQFIFVLKKGTSKSSARQRRREIDTFRSTNKSCTQAESSALKLVTNGVITKKLGRFTTATLPEGIRQDVLDANGQLFTTPRQGENGIGIMAICNTREIVDNSASVSEGLNVDVASLGNEELAKKSEQWMKALRNNSKIIIR